MIYIINLNLFKKILIPFSIINLNNENIILIENVNDKTDLAVLVFSASDNDIENEKVWFKDLKNKNIPIIGVINKIDLGESNLELLKDEFDIPFAEVSSKNKVNIAVFKEALINNAPIDFEMLTIL